MYIIVSVPVVFWGHTFPGDPVRPWTTEFQIKYNILTEGWGYTGQSALCGDTPYTAWINKVFKPNYEVNEEGVEHIQIVRELVVQTGLPKYMKFGLQKKFKFPAELQKQLNEWKYWEGTPEPDVSKYYQDIDLDRDSWQSEDAEVKNKGTDFE
jgi:hypothetical protein